MAKKLGYFDQPRKAYRITYHMGLGKPRTVYALDAKEAFNLGLAEFRKNYGSVETVDTSDPKTVVKLVEKLED